MTITMSYLAGAGAQFFDNNGVPLSGGKLYTYEAGTTTPAETYTTRAGTVDNANPIILNSAGRTPNEIWFTGGVLFKFVLTTSTDVLIGTYDDIASINDPTQNNTLITVTGTNALTGTSPSPITAYTTGYQATFIAVNANTAAVTIDIDGVGTKSITKNGAIALAAGDIVAASVCFIIYDGTQFELVGAVGGANINLAAGKTIVFEGTTNDDFETTLTVVDPTADRTVTLQNASGTVAYLTDIPSPTVEVPAGIVIYAAQNTAPTGYLKANGALISRTTYVDLFTAIGTTFGVGDGTTTFGLPDLRGEFLRGWDDGRSIDTGRVFGSAQSSANLAHTHTYPANTGTTGSLQFSLTSMDIIGAVNHASSSAGGTEARPRNIALLACIKF
jgi:microcystin-dependent protein